MTDAEFRDSEPPTALHLAVDFLKVRFWSIVAVLALVGIIVLYFEVEFALPRFWYLFALAFLVSGVPVGWIVGSKVTSMMHNPRRIYLIDLDARILDGGIYELTVDEFRDLQVTDETGNADADYRLTQLTSNLYVGKSLDEEAGTVVGTWRGTLDDVELARSLAAVKRCRGELQDKAQRGFAIETAAPAIVSNALRGEVGTLMDTIEAGTLPDEGDAVTDAIEERLDDLGFDDHLEEVVDDFDPDPGDERDPQEFEVDQEENGDAPESEPAPEADANG